jgi:hypothetical protein
MIEGFTSGPGGLDRDRQVLFHLFLADELS